MTSLWDFLELHDQGIEQISPKPLISEKFH